MFLAKPMLSTAEIIGIAFCGVLVILFIIELIYCLYRNLKKPKETQGMNFNYFSQKLN
jgi:hypothetical protein